MLKDTKFNGIPNEVLTKIPVPFCPNQRLIANPDLLSQYNV